MENTTQEYRACLLAGAATLGMALMSVPVMAQDQPEQPPTEAQAAQNQEIVVTGSRLARANVGGVSPVTVLNNAEIKLAGTTRVEDLVNSLPQAFASQGSTISNGSSGTATLSLRNLGPARTLVLVNGRRLLPGDPLTPYADVNFIPATLVERVEVLTGGASSVYGADAVAGVTNFILDNQFEGFRVDSQYGIYQHENGGDSRIRTAIREAQAAASDPSAYPLPSGNVVNGGSWDTTVSFGASADDGRAHVMAYAGYRQVEAVLQGDYDYSACSVSARVDEDAFDCGGSGTAALTRIQAFTDATLADRFANVVPSEISGGLAFRPRTGADLYNFAPTNYFQRPDKRWIAGAFADYDVSDSFKPYLEASFMDDRTVAQIAPSGAFGVQVTLDCANPLLTAAQRATLCPVGVTNPSLIVSRRNVEGGGRQADIGHTSYRLVLGAKGGIVDNWSYDLYGQYGRTNYDLTYRNDFSITRLQRALDVVADPVTGAPVCRSVLNGTDSSCVPLNYFRLPGLVGDVRDGVTQAALDYVQTPGFQRGQTTEQIVSGSISGDFGDSVRSPFSEEKIGLAVGAEYRKESLNLETDLTFQSGDLSGQGGPVLSNAGRFDVRELFGEVRIPIADNHDFFDQLTLEGGYRYSKYKQRSEGVPDNSFSTDTYKIGLEWAPIKEVRLRGSYNRAVRAPNVVELYTPAGNGLWAGVDPCSGATPEFTAAQCALTGVTAAQYGNIESNPAAQYNALFSGTPTLRPESADTWTAGIVFSPGGAFSGFTLAVDYFDIKVDDFIFSLPGGLAQIYLRACGLTGDARFCDAINRDPGTGSLFLTPGGFVRDPNVNTGSQHTRGIDVAADYRLDLDNVGLGGGSMSFNFVGTYTDKLETDTGIAINAAGETSYDCAGYFGVTCGVPTPDWRHKLRLTWTMPKIFTVSANWRYIGSVKDEQTQDNPYLAGTTFPANDKIKAFNFFDLSASADVSEHATLRIGVNNIFDKDPPIIGQDSLSGTFGNGNTYPQVYDALGRYMFVGGTFSF